MFGVPQGSNLGPLLFNIFFSRFLIHSNIDIANLADDNTPYLFAEVRFDSKLGFDQHIDLCRRASKKIHAVARVTPLMNLSKQQRLLMLNTVN